MKYFTPLLLVMYLRILFLAQIYGVIASFASGVDAGDEQGIVSVAAVACFGASVLRLRSATDAHFSASVVRLRSPTDAHFGSAQ